MKVKNLYQGQTYKWCKKLVSMGTFPSTILPPMKWEITFLLDSEEKAKQFIQRIDKIFGKSVDVIDWVKNRDAPWFYTVMKLQETDLYQKKLIEKVKVYVNLTTDEQLSYVQLAFTNIRVVKK